MRFASSDWNEDEDEDDDPEDWDHDHDHDDDDEETAVLPCPCCGLAVYEDAERCPHCGEYIIRRLRVWEGKPWWWIVLGLVGIGAVVWALI